MVRQQVRRVDLPTPSITRRLRRLHRRRRLYNPVGRTWLPSASAWQLQASWRLLCPIARAGELQASWRLLCPTARPWQLRASWRRPTARAWQLRGSRLWPTARSWQLGASWLRPCSLMSPRGWRACGCKPCNQSKSRAKSSKPDQTLRPGCQECRRWSRKQEEIVILNHVS
jgi:hypothetical protein